MKVSNPDFPKLVFKAIQKATNAATVMRLIMSLSN